MKAEKDKRMKGEGRKGDIPQCLERTDACQLWVAVQG